MTWRGIWAFEQESTVQTALLLSLSGGLRAFRNGLVRVPERSKLRIEACNRFYFAGSCAWCAEDAAGAARQQHRTWLMASSCCKRVCESDGPRRRIILHHVTPSVLR